MSKWVSCKDRLPEPETPVLIRAQFCWDQSWMVCVAELGVYFDGSKTYWSAVGSMAYGIENAFHDDSVTHWMPLPDLPNLDIPKD